MFQFTGVEFVTLYTLKFHDFSSTYKTYFSRHAGAYCPSGSEAQRGCLPGFYCPFAKEQLPCPAGEYCPANSSVPQECPLGHYCPQTVVDGGLQGYIFKSSTRKPWAF